ncbi:hypothetical protein H5410_052367 [Solanum commersonii]|uniref:Sesquiterpene synthase n=1 Tax=Solanum commersonii TaxID=4109 RepID=A0A9J5X375_SOLCO|nr:hypothetical protein H5410_052367 [Solanum commersonii]
MLLCIQTVAADHEVIITRCYGNHHPTVWGDHFLTYANLPRANEGEKKQHEDLKEEVRKMLVMAPSKSLHKLDLINTIQLLGVAYHFEHEIEESLSYMQQGYYVSCDAFRKFTNDQGNFKKELINNVHGMLSLYEAAQFRVHGEEIFDETLNFTTTQLKLILPKLSNSHLAQQVANALKITIKDGIVRVERRKYISVYQQNQNHNQVLLNFAKLDFNILQRLHKNELSDITSVARKILAKISYITCIIDDTCDIYGTLDELTQFTRAIERTITITILYCHLLDVYKEIEKELANENQSFLVDYSIIEMKKVLRAYFQEAEWYYNKKEVPRMEQYMKNGIPSSGYLLLATTSWLAMGNITTKDVFDWIGTEPPILVASCCITRLLNDRSSHEEEQKRGDAASSIECYMNEYDVTKEEAHIKLRNKIENYWKDLNEEYFKVDVTIIPRVLLMPIINLTRVVEFMYKDEDAYTF